MDERAKRRAGMIDVEPRVSGDEHPSGLRDDDELHDLIAEAVCWGSNEPVTVDEWAVTSRVYGAVRAYFAVVSEDEIDAAARAMYLFDNEDKAFGAWPPLSHDTVNVYRDAAESALAASRGVLLPKETRE